MLPLVTTFDLAKRWQNGGSGPEVQTICILVAVGTPQQPGLRGVLLLCVKCWPKHCT